MAAPLPTATTDQLITEALAYIAPGWRPSARPDTWGDAHALQAQADIFASLAVDFLVTAPADEHLARHFAAKAYLTREAASHMGERLGGAL